MKKQTYISIKAKCLSCVKIWVGAVVFSNKHKNLKHYNLVPAKLKNPSQ